MVRLLQDHAPVGAVGDTASPVTVLRLDARGDRVVHVVVNAGVVVARPQHRLRFVVSTSLDQPLDYLGVRCALGLTHCLGALLRPLPLQVGVVSCDLAQLG